MVNINPETYLKCTGKIGIIPIEHALGIMQSPNKFHYFNNQEYKTFTLIFKGIPDDWNTFCLYEEASEGNGFLVPNIHRNNSGIYHINLK